jgi:hypothetical protein
MTTKEAYELGVKLALGLSSDTSREDMRGFNRIMVPGLLAAVGGTGGALAGSALQRALKLKNPWLSGLALVAPTALGALGGQAAGTQLVRAGERLAE